MVIKIMNGRWKIVEQIAVVLFFAVVIPMTISGIIINNINQHALRSQLRETAVLITNMLSDEIDVFKKTNENNLRQIALTLDYFSTYTDKQNYINITVKNSKLYKNIFILNSDSEYDKLYEQCIKQNEMASKYQMKNGKYLVAIYDIDMIKRRLYDPLKDDKRNVYVTTYNKELIASYNYDDESFNKAVSQLPKNLEEGHSVVFGKIKNQPYVYYKKDIPKLLIIVTTPKDMTRAAIDYSRTNIILAVLIASLTVLFIVGLYTYYLYINIRQLFKGIIAISKGNYQRRIRLLSSVFTPYEIMFLASEFNRMIDQINKSYSKLKKSNKELKELNEFRSNMIDTVSHEFRTPLTSIQGYTSRLLRQDIEIDKETQQKSLRIIRKQSERLKRMIEDLLVIPDIEDSRLNVVMDDVDISKIIEESILLVKNESTKTIINNITHDMPTIYADRDRLEQVIINLIENAVKYADDNTDIIINANETDNNKVCIEIKNKYPLISREKLKTLFDKFTRIDDKTTRTTRGTGLGLFIVKGLVEAMNGEIRIYSTEEYGFISRLYFEKVKIQ